MKLFTCSQIRQIDAYTILNEPVKSADLMERAASALYSWISRKFSRSHNFLIFTGPGNNGGDGLALARMMTSEGFIVHVFNVAFADKTSADWQINRKRLDNVRDAAFTNISSMEMMPMIAQRDIVVDAIFGSGLTRKADGLAAEVIMEINRSGATVVSVDMPSGLFCEDNNMNDPESIIQADHTLSFQFPKLSFLFPENEKFIGSWEVLPIGLHEEIIKTLESPYRMITAKHLSTVLKKRRRFDHKGVFGHGLLIAGSYGKIGAAVLGAKAALRSGIGLLTCHVPRCGYEIMQTSVSEAMVISSGNEIVFSEISTDSDFDAAGIGPGLGTESQTCDALRKFIENCSCPLVLDADALNIIAMRKDILELLPAGSILTPHPGEFARLAGKSSDSYDRLMMQIRFATEHKCILVLKGAHTSVACPDGSVWFNNTGNPGMATAGSGDVLTGMLLSLLAQGYRPEDAAILGVHLHGLAGDLAAEIYSQEAIVSSDIINCLGKAFNCIRDTAD